jgi:terminal uridylyltransferase
MVLFVKAWAKRRLINSPYRGTLSSYGYVLMVLHFLINVAQPSVLPNLQLLWEANSNPSAETVYQSDTEVDGYDVRFWRDEEAIQKAAARGDLTKNQQSVGSLLRGFFDYYARQGPGVTGYGFSWSMDALSIRSRGGLISKKAKGWTGAKTTVTEPTHPGQQKKEVRHRYLFAIEDPFEIEHNIARTVTHPGIVAIRDEFRRAWRIIVSTGRPEAAAEALFDAAIDPAAVARKALEEARAGGAIAVSADAHPVGSRDEVAHQGAH